jgi:HEAT repeat protein
MLRLPALPRTLAAALRDRASPKASVRAEAVRDLVAHAGDARAEVVASLEASLGDEAPTVRAAAAIALADVQGVEAIDGLLDASRDADLGVQQMAITALGELADPRAADRLREALRDPRPEVRFQAAIAFPRVAPSRDEIVDVLLRLSRDDDPLVCHIALRMAEEQGHDASGGAGLDARVLVRARALLRHDEPRVRVAAAILLAHAGDEAAHHVLARVGRGDLHTDDGEDEAAAIELCGELGLSEARAGLEARAFPRGLGLRRDPFVWHARVALARMGHDRARSEILRDLGSWSRERRTLAIVAAGRARLEAARALLTAMRGDDRRADPAIVEEALAGLERAGAS